MSRWRTMTNMAKRSCAASTFTAKRWLLNWCSKWPRRSVLTMAHRRRDLRVRAALARRLEALARRLHRRLAARNSNLPPLRGCEISFHGRRARTKKKLRCEKHNERLPRRSLRKRRTTLIYETPNKRWPRPTSAPNNTIRTNESKLSKCLLSVSGSRSQAAIGRKLIL